MRGDRTRDLRRFKSRAGLRENIIQRQNLEETGLRRGRTKRRRDSQAGLRGDRPLRWCDFEETEFRGRS